MFELGRAAAQRALPDGPFRGVPFLLKDLLATYAGVPMALGSAFLKGFVPQQDSELVARLKRAGLIIVGKANTPEFGILPTTEPRGWPQPQSVGAAAHHRWLERRFSRSCGRRHGADGARQ